MQILSTCDKIWSGGDTMYRMIEKSLMDWKNNKDRKPLIIKGLRQVGKTYSVRKFAKENYDQIIEINFERDPKYIKLFQETRSPKELVEFIKFDNLKINFNDNTLIFFDEIQACPDALTALKFLKEEILNDIICSGSMLGVAIAGSTSFPVGYVEVIKMVPMNFIEFLMAKKIPESILKMLEETVQTLNPLPSSLHDEFIKIFKEYMICGGMPEVVKTYTETNSMVNSIKIQRMIVNDYINDMAKYASKTERVKVHECFKSIPNQLAKENKKFQYKLVQKGYGSRHYEGSLQWLKDAGLIIDVNRLSKIELPLEVNVDMDVFKVYMADTGLLLSQFDDTIINTFVEENLNSYKGFLYENVYAQMLHAHNKECYYYEPNTTSEIDFIIYFQGNIVPLEIKSSKNTVSKSFVNFVKNHESKIAFRLSSKNIGTNGQVTYFPHYLFPFLLNQEKSILGNNFIM